MADAKLLVGAVLAIGLVIALVGPPPSANHSPECVVLALTATAMYLIALVAAITVAVTVGTLLAGPGVLAFGASCWLSRGPDPPEGEGGGHGPPPDLPIDWDDFDRRRAEWDRTRVPV